MPPEPIIYADWFQELKDLNQSGKSKSEPKPLAQYLDEYIKHEAELRNIEPPAAYMYAYNSWRELLEQALDAYESTENVVIQIIKKKIK